MDYETCSWETSVQNKTEFGQKLSQHVNQACDYFFFLSGTLEQ